MLTVPRLDKKHTIGRLLFSTGMSSVRAEVVLLSKATGDSIRIGS
jgi:hypothetical protein